MSMGLWSKAFMLKTAPLASHLQVGSADHVPERSVGYSETEDSASRVQNIKHLSACEHRDSENYKLVFKVKRFVCGAALCWRLQ